jgi:N-hydroxyarylamine O-acetyltransferase
MMLCVRLDDYLRKVGMTVPRQRTSETLRRLHRAHRETFLFENLTIQRGGSISLAIPDLERKFLDEGGGGYCFEHSTLLSAVLADLGFSRTSLLARVRRGPPEFWVRTHMVLRVPVDGEPWLVDVGFGGLGLLEPIQLRDGAVSEQGGARYVLRREGVLWVLSMRDRTGEYDLYEFADDPQTVSDIEVANHYTSTHPSSLFRRVLTIQRVAGDERTIMRSHVLVRFVDGMTTEAPFGVSQLRAIAWDVFGVRLPPAPLLCELDAARAEGVEDLSDRRGVPDGRAGRVRDVQDLT